MPKVVKVRNLPVKQQKYLEAKCRDQGLRFDLDVPVMGLVPLSPEVSGDKEIMLTITKIKL